MSSLAEYTTVLFDIDKALAFLKACETSKPRVGYKLGAKCKPGAVPGLDFKAIDCSGFVRECVRRATNLGSSFPDGSVVQHDWVRRQGYERLSGNMCFAPDNGVKIAFLNPAGGEPGHVALVHDGKTLESHANVGPDSRGWDWLGWQARAELYVLAPAKRGTLSLDAFWRSSGLPTFPIR